MDNNRRSVRHLDPKDNSSRSSTANPFRASTVDSGRESMTTSARSTTLESRATTDMSSLSTRDTPLDSHDDTIHADQENNEPVRVRPTLVLGKRCYEQAYVSYVYHPSAFFVQLPHHEGEYKRLHREINEYYSKNSISDPSTSWRAGEYCIAKYTDNQFYRARIIATSEEIQQSHQYDVVFIDFGNWDRLNSINIYKLQREFTGSSAQAIPCTLTKSLPRRGDNWFDNPDAMKFFEHLVLDKYVDVTFQLKGASKEEDSWHLTFVDLQLSSDKTNVRDQMAAHQFIREAPNRDIYYAFIHSLKRVDYYIFDIPHEGDEYHSDD